jgi:hypothetical protein
MNKKIKVIELLNKIANGEDLPKRIKIQDYVFELSKDYEHYYYNEDVEITHLINHNFSNLNDEVEILEDNIEEIEEIPQYRIDNCTDYNYCYLAEKYNKLAKTVNQIRKDFKK